MTGKTFPADQVKRLRQSLGWTQQELADYLQVTPNLVSMWENDKRTPAGPAAVLLGILAGRSLLQPVKPR